jgi:hypothetical protein
VLTAPKSPWQNPYVEHLAGSIRRECLDHVIVSNQMGLRRILKLYFKYHERARTHLSLEKDAPIPRSVQSPELGRVVELPEVGGLQHRYKRSAAWLARICRVQKLKVTRSHLVRVCLLFCLAIRCCWHGAALSSIRTVVTNANSWQLISGWAQTILHSPRWKTIAKHGGAPPKDQRQDILGS